MQSSDDLAISQRFVALLPAQKPARLERRAQAGAGQKNYWQITDGQPGNQCRERLGCTSLRQGGEPGGLVPRIQAEPRQRRDNAERYSILFFAD